MLRNAKLTVIRDWLGLQTFSHRANLDPAWWIEANNVVVTNDGSAGVLRSPKNFHDPFITPSGNKIVSAFEFVPGGSTQPILLFEAKNASGGSDIYKTTGTTNTFVASASSNSALSYAVPVVYISVNNKVYMLTPNLSGSYIPYFNQTTGVNNYPVGIIGPTSAPTLSYIAGGSGSFATGIYISYAYRNSTTGHISKPSPVSTQLGATGANHTVRTAVTASTGPGVDGIVLFVSLDAGSIPYLLVDSSGNPRVFSNATGNIDISVDQMVTAFLDTLTPEPLYNEIPVSGYQNMFRWKDRLFLCNNLAASERGKLPYSGFESVYYGIPWESWPPLNVINIPNKADGAQCGIETPLGALILGEQDSYLLSGYPSDKTSGPEAGVSVTEHIEQLGWSIGTRFPRTLVNTPYGQVWLDQNKRLQLWTGEGTPKEVGLPIRTSLAAITDQFYARQQAQAVWYQHGDEGGHYVLTASNAASVDALGSNGVNNLLFVLSIYRDPETNQLHFAHGVSNIAAQTLVVYQDSTGHRRLYAGQIDRLREILNLTAEGAGWTGESRYFSIMLGTDVEFAYFHSIRFDATSILGLTITVSNPDDSEAQDVAIEQTTGTSGSFFGLLKTYGYLKKLTFSFDAQDSDTRVIQNLRIAAGPKKRLI